MMEANMSSKGSSGVDHMSMEGLDSNSGDRYLAYPNNHFRHYSQGSQIYDSSHQIWLMTLTSEKAPEIAPHPNFPWTNVTEPNFSGQYSQEPVVLEMIRGSSFQPRFQELHGDNYGNNTKSGIFGLYLSALQKGGGFSRKLLFRKTLTPSDVGRLNRIVIPKKNATECFPEISRRMEEEANTHDVLPEVQVDFYDRWMRCWKFRYCYWRTSQSYVFTRGWSRFVKDKDLKVNDVVAFYLCEIQMEGRIVNKFFMIDPVGGEDSCGSSGVSSVIEVDDPNNNIGLTSQPELGGSGIFEGSSSHHHPHHHDVELMKPELCSDDAENKRLGKEVVMDSDPPRAVEIKAVRLFGVQIN